MEELLTHGIYYNILFLLGLAFITLDKVKTNRFKEGVIRIGLSTYQSEYCKKQTLKAITLNKVSIVLILIAFLFAFLKSITLDIFLLYTIIPFLIASVVVTYIFTMLVVLLKIVISMVVFNLINASYKKKSIPKLYDSEKQVMELFFDSVYLSKLILVYSICQLIYAVFYY